MGVWIIDADRLSLNDDGLKVIYRNKSVDHFLNNNSMLGIASVKGNGKTFLLKIKRKSHQNKGIFCLPENAMVDCPEPPNFDKSLANYLNDINNWVCIWKVAISLSIIKSCKFSYFENNDYKRLLSDEIINIINLPFKRTCQIFDYLLSLKRSKLNVILTHAASKLVGFMNSDNVDSAVHIFIDKVDHAFSREIFSTYGGSPMSKGPRNASFWQYAQYALAIASYSLFAKNNHIKVYYAIRQEALLDVGKLIDTSINVHGYISHLEYTYDDLNSMYDLYIENENDDQLYNPEYKNTNPSLAFIGVDTFEHSYIKSESEELFDYIYRHSLKRPRDIMDICSRLCLNMKKNVVIDHIKLHVNAESRVILDAFLSEIEPFAFAEIKFEVEIFSRLMNTNVMNADMIRFICNKYNEKLIDHFKCNEDCRKCMGTNVFCTLYNIGLIGIISSNRLEDDYIQNFQDIGNAIMDIKQINLPKAQLYLMHPMLTNKIESSRSNFNQEFHATRQAIIGDKLIFKRSSVEPALKEAEHYFKELKTGNFGGISF